MSQRAFDKYNPVSWSSDASPATEVPVHVESDPISSYLDELLADGWIDKDLNWLE